MGCHPAPFLQQCFEYLGVSCALKAQQNATRRGGVQGVWGTRGEEPGPNLLVFLGMIVSMWDVVMGDDRLFSPPSDLSQPCSLQSPSAVCLSWVLRCVPPPRVKGRNSPWGSWAGWAQRGKAEYIGGEGGSSGGSQRGDAGMLRPCAPLRKDAPRSRNPWGEIRKNCR